ncbi:hypothetical protein ACHAWF_006843, partial [Thalassiosira exigua]
SLRIIHIYSNLIGDRGGQSFANALESTYSIEWLSMWGNKISGSVMRRIYAILCDPQRKALTSKLDKQESTKEKASNGGRPGYSRASNDKRKLENAELIQGSNKRQKNGEDSNADEAAGSVSPPVVPNSSAKTASVKKEEVLNEDLDADTEGEDEGAEPVYVTYTVLRPLLEKV